MKILFMYIAHDPQTWGVFLSYICITIIPGVFPFYICIIRTEIIIIIIYVYLKFEIEIITGLHLKFEILLFVVLFERLIIINLFVIFLIVNSGVQKLHIGKHIEIGIVPCVTVSATKQK